MKKLFLIFMAITLLSSCGSIQKAALNAVSDMLSGDGSSDVFTGDNDPQLVGDAIPFAIKIYEILYSMNPGHAGMAQMTGSLFVMYANAFVQGPAEMLPTSEYKAREEGLARAKSLYLRGMDILYDGLDTKYKGFKQAAEDPEKFKAILKKLKKEDIGFLYWAVAGGMSAYSLDLFDFALGVRIPQWTAMIERAYELNPDYDGLDELFVIIYSSLPDMLGGDMEKAKAHYQRAQDKTGGKSVGSYVAYAQCIAMPAQDYDTYKDCLEKALAINPDDDPSTRLVNIITQRKARWLLDNAYMYFSFLPIPENY